MKIMKKKISFNGQIFVLPSVCYYVLCELKFGIKYDLLPASKVLKYLRK